MGGTTTPAMHAFGSMEMILQMSGSGCLAITWTSLKPGQWTPLFMHSLFSRSHLLVHLILVLPMCVLHSVVTCLCTSLSSYPPAHLSVLTCLCTHSVLLCLCT